MIPVYAPTRNGTSPDRSGQFYICFRERAARRGASKESFASPIILLANDRMEIYKFFPLIASR